MVVYQEINSGLDHSYINQLTKRYIRTIIIPTYIITIQSSIR